MSEFLDRFAEAFMAIDKGDMSKLVGLFDDDIEFVTPERAVRGREAAASYLMANNGAFSDVKHIVDFENGVIDGGHAFCVEFLVCGSFTNTLQSSEGMAPTVKDAPDMIASTGRQFQLRSTDHVWHKNGRITRFHIYYDPNEFFRQLGWEGLAQS